MRTLLLTAVLASALIWGALTMSRMDAGITQVLGTLQAKTKTMNTLTFSKTLADGTVVTYTATQRPGETLAEFAARARREWAEICEGLGG